MNNTDTLFTITQAQYDRINQQNAEIDKIKDDYIDFGAYYPVIHSAIGLVDASIADAGLSNPDKLDAALDVRGKLYDELVGLVSFWKTWYYQQD